MKAEKTRLERAMVGASFLAAAIIVIGLGGAFRTSTPHAGTAADLQGKWVGQIAWNSASPSRYERTLRTTCEFLPNGTVNTVFRFPTGAVGGVGRYTFQNSRLSVTCTSLNIDGHSVPMTLFAHRPWFQPSATYQVAWDGDNLLLTGLDPDKPQPAVAYPLLTSPKSVLLEPSEKYLVEHPHERFPVNKVTISGEGEG